MKNMLNKSFNSKQTWMKAVWEHQKVVFWTKVELFVAAQRLVPSDTVLALEGLEAEKPKQFPEFFSNMKPESQRPAEK